MTHPLFLSAIVTRHPDNQLSDNLRRKPMKNFRESFVHSKKSCNFANEQKFITNSLTTIYQNEYSVY